MFVTAPSLPGVAGHAGFCTNTVALALLFDEVGSLVPVVICPVFVRLPAVAGAVAEKVIVAVAPGAMLPRAQLVVPAVQLPSVVEALPMSVKPAGSVSVKLTLFEVNVPLLFVTVNEKLVVPLTSTGSGVGFAWVMLTSAVAGRRSTAASVHRRLPLNVVDVVTVAAPA